MIRSRVAILDRTLADLLAACILLSSAAAAQEPTRPTARQALTQDLKTMSALRAGKWSEAGVENLIVDLQAKGYIRAAQWWISEAQVAVKASKLPRRLGSKLKKQARRLALAAPPGDEAKDLRRTLIKHLKVLISRRNHAESRKVLPAAQAMVVAFPDKGTARKLTRIKQTVEANGEQSDLNPKMLPRHREISKTLVARARALIRGRIESDLEEYAAAGCEAGQRAIRHCIVQLYGSIENKSARPLIVRLRRIRHQIELTATLKIWILGDPKSMRVTRDGEPIQLKGTKSSFSTEKLQPISLQALPGDLIRFHPSGGREKGATIIIDSIYTSSILAVHALWKGRPVPVDQWGSIPGSEKSEMEPEVHEIVEGEKVPAENKRDADQLKRLGVDAKADQFVLKFESPSGFGGFTLLWNGRYQSMEKTLKEKEIPISWITAVTKDSVFVLRVPE